VLGPESYRWGKTAVKTKKGAESQRWEKTAIKTSEIKSRGFVSREKEKSALVVFLKVKKGVVTFCFCLRKSSNFRWKRGVTYGYLTKEVWDFHFLGPKRQDLKTEGIRNWALGIRVRPREDPTTIPCYLPKSRHRGDKELERMEKIIDMSNLTLQNAILTTMASTIKQ